jgi:two-component system capsular synthesis sensor histidine kinase RcsC
MNAWLVKPLNLHTLRTQLLRHCKLAEPLPFNPAPPAADTVLDADRPQLSPKMRELFFSTMLQDIDTLNATLQDNDTAAVIRQLHSMAGALGAVQAADLAQTCIDLENRLEGRHMTLDLASDIEAMLGRLSAMLDALA